MAARMLRWSCCVFGPLLAAMLILDFGLAHGSASNPKSNIQNPISWDPACYRTNAQIEAFLQSVASTYPQIATLSDAGLSWEGSRHLWLLRLSTEYQVPSTEWGASDSVLGTRHSVLGTRPSILLLAGQHPRDIATPEMLLRYISYLVQGYGVDPDVTWLLDNRSLWIVPMANPDGYHQVYTAMSPVTLKKCHCPL